MCVKRDISCFVKLNNMMKAIIRFKGIYKKKKYSILLIIFQLNTKTVHFKTHCSCCALRVWNITRDRGFKPRASQLPNCLWTITYLHFLFLFTSSLSWGIWYFWGYLYEQLSFSLFQNVVVLLTLIFILTLSYLILYKCFC